MAEARPWAQRLVTGAAALALWACSPTLDWREFRPDGTTLVVLMPCRPASHTRVVKGLGPSEGTSMTMHACKAGSSLYAVGWLDAPKPASVGDTMLHLLEAAATNTRADAASLKDQAFDLVGATPSPHMRRRQWRGTMPDGAPVLQEMVVFAKGLRVYQATVVITGSRVDAAQAEGPATLFGSLRWK